MYKKEAAMDRSELERIIKIIYAQTPGNVIKNAPELPGRELLMYDEPIFGIGAADDALFEKYKEPGVIGPWYKAPSDWLSGASSVVSIFFPFSEEVKASNAACSRTASVEWAFARIEGQAFISACLEKLSEALRDKGIMTCVPSSDPSFFSIVGGRASAPVPGVERGSLYPGAAEDTFSSVWSERHAAFVCGLGTFGMSRGLITRKGMAGRFGSIITDAQLPADERPYTGIYEYCIKCGSCSKRCPADAIPEGELKDHRLCAPAVTKSRETLAPRYGCGLCQTGVPCESSIPGK